MMSVEIDPDDWMAREGGGLAKRAKPPNSPAKLDGGRRQENLTLDFGGTWIEARVKGLEPSASSVTVQQNIPLLRARIT